MVQQKTVQTVKNDDFATTGFESIMVQLWDANFASFLICLVGAWVGRGEVGP